MRCELRTILAAALFSFATLVSLAPPGIADSAATCALGETRNPTTTVFSFNEPQYSVFQLVRPSDCTSCTAGMAELKSATWRLRFFSSCTVTVEVSVVGASDGPCPAPDTTAVLCPPAIVQYTPSTTSSGQNVVFPVSLACCISQPAFVRLKMLDRGVCSSTDFIPFQIGLPAEECSTCRSYSLPPGQPLQDSCVSPGVVPTISVQSDCCVPTPIESRSWGQLKTSYR